jgi:hypothetical protein
MRKIVQIVAWLNAAFGLLVGLLAVASPVAAAGAFKVSVDSPAMLALIRMFGGLLASSGVVSGFIARDPDAHPALARTYAAILLLNVATDGLVIASQQMRFDQVASGMLLELLLAVLLLFHFSRISSTSR